MIKTKQEIIDSLEYFDTSEGLMVLDTSTSEYITDCNGNNCFDSYEDADSWVDCYVEDYQNQDRYESNSGR